MRVLGAALLLPWSIVHAESLPELIEGVLSSHPSVRSQKAQGESAKEAVEGAKWQFYPTPSIGFEQVSTTNADTSYSPLGDKNVTTVRLQQPLWTGGRLTAGLNKAQAGVVVSQATLEGVRQDLALRVVQSYADWYGAQLKRLASAKSLRAHQTLQDQISRRIAGGVSPRSDLTLLLGRAQQTEADLSTAQAQEQAALGRLSQLLGHALAPGALEAALSAAQPLGGTAQDLLQAAQAHNPNVIKLQAQARIAQAEIAEHKADLLPEVYLRAESQYGSYTYPNTPTQNRYFLGFSSRFGAGLSSLSQVSAAQARYTAALADIESTQLSLGEQIQADYAQATAGQQRLSALQASLDSADTIARAWNRQFVAGRKTWSDVMNAVRELAQIEAQIADAKSAQLLLTWRLAIVGRGLENTLQSASLQTSGPQQVGIADPPLYPQTPADAIQLRMAQVIDPLNLGLGLGLSATPSNHKDSEATW